MWRVALKRRWYDTSPTLSMAISFLQTAEPNCREQASAYIYSYLKEYYPEILIVPQETASWTLWPFGQNRRVLNDLTWMTIESIRNLPPTEREKVAIELISFMYCLEYGDFGDAHLASLSAFYSLETAV
jgi:hypothetical protein